MASLQESINETARKQREFFNNAFTDPVKGEPYPVPAALREISERICVSYGIRGVCDPMYIANIIAFELGLGDGKHSFKQTREAVPATRFDVPAVIRELLVTACHYKVLDMADAFALGMNQEARADWEQWDDLVNDVVTTAWNARQSIANGADAHAAIVKVAERYWQEQHEAKADAASEYTGPELD